MNRVQGQRIGRVLTSSIDKLSVAAKAGSDTLGYPSVTSLLILSCPR